ncbi:amidohydrolase family protein [Halomonas sp. OfavH-34-E]|uniref:amidohydrolase family protein n=1 Tax=Halomonas sp. OfavH-34-E TaxID=2954491 RepID=UPI002097DCB9|nr:amidohydrolase family protein [Halomonas sp. OfavH-34-E]MCO7217452.1 amidohydrolase family protein [Halomonas sp. OfavH-34-E]
MIDTHLHVWDTGAVRIPWLADAGLPARAPIPDGQDRRYVLVEADAPDPAEEAAWLISLAEQNPRVHGVVASVALELPQAERALASLAEVPQVVGVRRLLQDRELFDSTALVEGLKRLADWGLPFDACVRDRELPRLLALLEQVPELTVVLDHMGKPNPRDGVVRDAWKRNLARLAELDRVHCKLSGLPAECRDADELERHAADIVDVALETFGAERCLLGSDSPISQDPKDWCERVLARVPAEKRQAVAEDNALNIYHRRDAR